MHDMEIFTKEIESLRNMYNYFLLFSYKPAAFFHGSSVGKMYVWIDIEQKSYKFLHIPIEI